MLCTGVMIVSACVVIVSLGAVTVSAGAVIAVLWLCLQVL